MSYSVQLDVNHALDTAQFKALAGGKVWIGVPDGSPATVPGDRIQIYLARQGLADLAIAQPLDIGPGGQVMYSGTPAQIKVLVPYCVQIMNSLGVQKYYTPKSNGYIEKFIALDAVNASQDIEINKRIKTVATFADLSADATPIGGQISLLGHSIQGIGGDLFDVVSASGLTANTGTIVVNGLKAYLRKQKRIIVEDFGAIGDGVTINNTAIQNAIDYLYSIGGGILKFSAGKTYLLEALPYYTDAGPVLGAHCIKLKDGVILEGEGSSSVLKLKNGAYGPGAFFRMISSKDGTRLSNSGLYNIAIDGNVANQVASVQCSNVVLEALTNVFAVRVLSYNCNGNGIMIRGTTTQYATNILFCQNVVSGCTSIGIQSSQFNGLVIADNSVSSTGDNLIDIYGENGTVSTHGNRFIVHGNNVSGGLTGVFCETVSQGIVGVNTVQSCSVGIIVNRINGMPRSVKICDNMIIACQIPVRITGDCYSVSITENTLDNFSSSGIQLGGGGNCSYIDVSRNTFIPATNTTPCILTSGATVSFCTGRDNVVISNGITAGYLLIKTAATHVNVSIGGFRVLPNQVGPDAYGELAQFTQLNLQNGTANNTAGPVVISIPDGYAGQLHITSRQSGTGKSYWAIPFVKSGGVLALGTAVKAFITADPITSATVSANNVSMALGADNTYLQWGLQATAVT
jgi:hypothetical protein